MTYCQRHWDVWAETWSGVWSISVTSYRMSVLTVEWKNICRVSRLRCNVEIREHDEEARLETIVFPLFSPFLLPLPKDAINILENDGQLCRVRSNWRRVYLMVWPEHGIVGRRSAIQDPFCIGYPGKHHFSGEAFINAYRPHHAGPVQSPMPM